MNSDRPSNTARSADYSVRSADYSARSSDQNNYYPIVPSYWVPDLSPRNLTGETENNNASSGRATENNTASSGRATDVSSLCSTARSLNLNIESLKEILTKIYNNINYINYYVSTYLINTTIDLDTLTNFLNLVLSSYKGTRDSTKILNLMIKVCEYCKKENSPESDIANRAKYAKEYLNERLMEFTSSDANRTEAPTTTTQTNNGQLNNTENIELQIPEIQNSRIRTAWDDSEAQEPKPAKRCCTIQ